MSDHSSFSTWLKRCRVERGLTQDELGELVGYAGQTIRKIEGGQRRPSLQLAARLAQVLQLAPDQQAAWMLAAREADTPDEPPAPEPLRTPTPSRGLPVYLTPFIGREREHADLTRLLGRSDCRLVTALGPGGVGKTRLAVEVARTIPGFADGVAFVSLASLGAPQAIVPAIADALGLTFVGTSDPATQLLAYLRGRHSLLVLDNLEHLLDPEGQTLGLLGQLLAEAPQVTLLVTSRERLKLAGEWILELGGLAVPPASTIAGQADYPALTLFVEHAQRVQHSFVLAPQNGTLIGTICRLVDGFPLGIELAATWLRVLSLDEIARELTSSLDTTHLSPGALPPRHHSLRAVVEHSWSLLGAAECDALRRLAVFRGGFTREAAAQIAGASLGVLASLVDKSLLRRASGGRYDLHEIIRQYAEARLREQPDEQAATRDRHGRYFMSLLAERDAMLKGAQQTEATAELSAEIDNIRVAWQHAVERGWLDALERAAEALQWFFEYRSWHHEGVALFLQAAAQLRAAVPGPDADARRRTIGRLLGHYGYVAARVGHFAAARQMLDESLDLLPADRDPAGRAKSLVHQGVVALWIGEYELARHLLAQSLELATACNAGWTVALATTWASIAAHILGEHAEAERLFRSGLAWWRATGSPRAVLWCITACSNTLITLGKHQEAQQLLRESLRLGQSSDDRYGMALALHKLGRVALRQQEGAEAAYLLREALAIMHSFNTWDAALILNDLGAALQLTGANAEAARSYREAFATALSIDIIPHALQALAGLAALLAHEERYAEALALAIRVLADPASRSGTRAQAEVVRAQALAQLTPEQVAAIEAGAAERSLVAIREELAA